MDLLLSNTVALELRTDNPYSLSEIFTFKEGDSILTPPKVIYSRTNKDRYYTMDDQDNFSDISFKAYGSSKYGWIIYLVNYQINPNLLNPFEIPPGTSLLIPDLESFKLQNNA